MRSEKSIGTEDFGRIGGDARIAVDFEEIRKSGQLIDDDIGARPGKPEDPAGTYRYILDVFRYALNLNKVFLGTVTGVVAEFSLGGIAFFAGDDFAIHDHNAPIIFILDEALEKESFIPW